MRAKTFLYKEEKRKRKKKKLKNEVYTNKMRAAIM